MLCTPRELLALGEKFLCPASVLWQTYVEAWVSQHHTVFKAVSIITTRTYLRWIVQAPDGNVRGAEPFARRSRCPCDSPGGMAAAASLQRHVFVNTLTRIFSSHQSECRTARITGTPGSRDCGSSQEYRRCLLSSPTPSWSHHELWLWHPITERWNARASCNDRGQW